MPRTRVTVTPQQVRRRALAIARVLKIQPTSYAGRERQAYHIMSHLAGMPTVRNKARRRGYGIEVLENAAKLMPQDHPQNGQFHWRIRELVISMQEFPAWYAILRKDNQSLVNDYLNLRLIVGGMSLVGLGGLTGILGDVAKGALAGGQRSTTAGTGRFGNVVRGGLGGARGAATGGLAGTLGLVWVVGSVAYVAIEQNMIDVGNEITRRYQEQKMPVELYQKAFGEDVPVPEQFLTRVPR